MPSLRPLCVTKQRYSNMYMKPCSIGYTNMLHFGGLKLAKIMIADFICKCLRRKKGGGEHPLGPRSPLAMGAAMLLRSHNELAWQFPNSAAELESWHSRAMRRWMLRFPHRVRSRDRCIVFSHHRTRHIVCVRVSCLLDRKKMDYRTMPMPKRWAT